MKFLEFTEYGNEESKIIVVQEHIAAVRVENGICSICTSGGTELTVAEPYDDVMAIIKGTRRQGKDGGTFVADDGVDNSDPSDDLLEQL